MGSILKKPCSSSCFAFARVYVVGARYLQAYINFIQLIPPHSTNSQYTGALHVSVLAGQRYNPVHLYLGSICSHNRECKFDCDAGCYFEKVHVLAIFYLVLSESIHLPSLGGHYPGLWRNHSLLRHPWTDQEPAGGQQEKGPGETQIGSGTLGMALDYISQFTSVLFIHTQRRISKYVP